MKKYIVLFTILLGSGFVASAQEEQPADEVKKQERIKALYVAYVSNHLELNPEEAQKFWPLHTQFETELKAVKPDLPELEKQQAILNIKKKYQENFNRIVGPKRCERFFRLDGEFTHKLLEKIRVHRPNQGIRPKLRMRT